MFFDIFCEGNMYYKTAWIFIYYFYQLGPQQFKSFLNRK
jgi:hypothetical protein